MNCKYETENSGYIPAGSVSNATSTTNSSYTISTSYNDYNNYCWHRLPCGICNMTNQICPKGTSNAPSITWTTGTTTAKDPDIKTMCEIKP